MQNSNYIQPDQSALNDIILAGRYLLMPRVLKPLSVWAPDHRYISRAESARPGMWDNSIAPFAVPVMDAFSDPRVERITMVGPSQLVKTEIIKNIIAYIVDNMLGPVLIIYPSDGAARDFSVEKLEPMIKYNDWLRDKIAPAKSNSKENKTLFKKFGPYFIAIVGGNVPQDLARRSVKYVIVDDRDRVGTAGNEGDASELAWQRTESYAFLGRKRIEISSPTIEGASPIMDAYKDSDMGEWFVSCPHCNHYQVMNFDNIVWDKVKDMFGKTDEHLTKTAKLKCENCNELIDEKYKFNMILNGKRVCKHPEKGEHFGMKLNRLYSTMSSWADVANQFLGAKNDRFKLQVFYNTALAKTWRLEKGEAIDETSLLARCEDYLTEENPKLPNKIMYLTCSVDTQGDRLEVQVEGWGYEEENWTVHYDKLWGDPDMQDVWLQLDEFLEKTWKREDGVVLKLGGILSNRRYYATVIDTQGKNTKSVYDYVMNRQHKGVFGIRGRGGTGLPPVINRSKVGPYRQVQLYNLGVDTIKEVIWRRLKYAPKDDDGNFKGGPRTCHFTTACCDPDYFKMLLAERPFITQDRALKQIILWKKVMAGARNEPWDLKVYNYAALLISNVNFKRLEENLLKQLNKNKKEDETTPPGGKKLNKRRVPLRSGFIDGWK